MVLGVTSAVGRRWRLESIENPVNITGGIPIQLNIMLFSVAVSPSEVVNVLGWALVRRDSGVRGICRNDTVEGYFEN